MMLGWIKKRCRRRSLPPSIKQLYEIARDTPCPSPYVSHDEETDENVYEDFAIGKSHDRCDDTYKPLVTPHSPYGHCYENIINSVVNEHSSVINVDATICPLCRSTHQHSVPCSCTNVYEEPRIVDTSPSDYTMPHDWSSISYSPSDYEATSTTKRSEVLPSSVITEALDAVYELATCPFKMPKTRHRPVLRSVSDASSRPLPKIPFYILPQKRKENSSGDDSSGYYESIESDCSSSQCSQDYSDITGSGGSQCYTVSLDRFQDLSNNDEVDYEEFNFQPDLSTPKCRRYSLGSSITSRTSQSLNKRQEILNHSETSDKVLSREESRRGPLFRSFRVRSLFKPK